MLNFNKFIKNKIIFKRDLIKINLFFFKNSFKFWMNNLKWLKFYKIYINQNKFKFTYFFFNIIYKFYINIYPYYLHKYYLYLLYIKKIYLNTLNNFKIYFFKFFYIFYYFNIKFYNKINIELNININEFNLYDNNKYYKLSTFNKISKNFPKNLIFIRNYSDFFNVYKTINLKIKDLKILIYLEYFEKNITPNIIYKFDYFYLNKKLNIYLFSDFLFKIDLVYFFIYKHYIIYIKRYKYNEYIQNHPLLYNFPYIKLFLRLLWRKRSFVLEKRRIHIKMLLENNKFFFYELNLFNNILNRKNLLNKKIFFMEESSLINKNKERKEEIIRNLNLIKNKKKREETEIYIFKEIKYIEKMEKKNFQIIAKENNEKYLNIKNYYDIINKLNYYKEDKFLIKNNLNYLDKIRNNYIDNYKYNYNNISFNRDFNNINKVSKKNIIELLMKNNFIKFSNIINLKFYKYLNKYFSNNIYIYIFYFVWFTNMFHYEYDDWVEIEKIKASNITILAKKMISYGFDMKYYYYMNILEYILDEYFLNYKNILIYFNNKLLKLNINLFNILSIFWYKILNIVFVNLFEFLTDNFFNEFTLNSGELRNKRKRKKDLLKRIFKYYKFFIKNLIFNFLPENKNYYFDKNLLLNYLNYNKDNLNNIFWKILFITNNNYSYYLKLNFPSIVNKINIDNILLQNNNLILNLYNFFLFKNIEWFQLINILILYLFLHNNFKKINFKLYSIYNLNYNKNYINIFYKYNQFNKFLYNYKSYLGIYRFWAHYTKFINDYKYNHEFNFIYFIFIGFIVRYYKLLLNFLLMMIRIKEYSNFKVIKILKKKKNY
jgi:hypothetical protein